MPARTEPKPPPSPRLPVPEHARRLPAHLSLDDLQRVRQAAYNLPQVVQPADFIDDDDNAPGFEQHLDRRGLILLQKAAAGARRSAAR